MNYISTIKHITKKYFSKKLEVIIPIALAVLVNFILVFTTDLFSLLVATQANFIISIGILGLPLFIYRLKKDNETNRLYKNWSESWKLTYWVSLLAFFYIIVMTILGFMFNIAIASIYYVAKSNLLSLSTFLQSIEVVSWFEVLFYLGYAIILVIALAFLINCFVKNKTVAYIVVASLFLINFFFVGNIPYVYLLNNVFAGFRYIAFFSYTSINSFVAFANNGAFMFKLDFIKNVDHIVKLMNFTIPFILISICCGLSSHFFRWFETSKFPIRLNNKTQLLKEIINIEWVLISLANVILAMIFLIEVNHDDKLISNWKYINGSLLLIAGIISTSLSAGYLVKNLYVLIFNKKIISKFSKKQ